MSSLLLKTTLDVKNNLYNPSTRNRVHIPQKKNTHIIEKPILLTYNNNINLNKIGFVENFQP